MKDEADQLVSTAEQVAEDETIDPAGRGHDRGSVSALILDRGPQHDDLPLVFLFWCPTAISLHTINIIVSVLLIGMAFFSICPVTLCRAETMFQTKWDHLRHTRRARRDEEDSTDCI